MGFIRRLTTGIPKFGNNSVTFEFLTPLSVASFGEIGLYAVTIDHTKNAITLDYHSLSRGIVNSQLMTMLSEESATSPIASVKDNPKPFNLLERLPPGDSSNQSLEAHSITVVAKPGKMRQALQQTLEVAKSFDSEISVDGINQVMEVAGRCMPEGRELSKKK